MDNEVVDNATLSSTDKSSSSLIDRLFSINQKSLRNRSEVVEHYELLLDGPKQVTVIGFYVLILISGLLFNAAIIWVILGKLIEIAISPDHRFNKSSTYFVCKQMNWMFFVGSVKQEDLAGHFKMSNSTELLRYLPNIFLKKYLVNWIFFLIQLPIYCNIDQNVKWLGQT